MSASRVLKLLTGMGDGLMYQDKPDSDPIHVQAKRWSDKKMHSKEIREFIGSVSLRGVNGGGRITTLFSPMILN